MNEWDPKISMKNDDEIRSFQFVRSSNVIVLEKDNGWELNEKVIERERERRRNNYEFNMVDWVVNNLNVNSKICCVNWVIHEERYGKLIWHFSVFFFSFSLFSQLLILFEYFRIWNFHVKILCYCLHENLFFKLKKNFNSKKIQSFYKL